MKLVIHSIKRWNNFRFERVFSPQKMITNFQTNKRNNLINFKTNKSTKDLSHKILIIFLKQLTLFFNQLIKGFAKVNTN